MIKWNELNRSAAGVPMRDLLLWGFYGCQPARVTELDVWQSLEVTPN